MRQTHELYIIQQRQGPLEQMYTFREVCRIMNMSKSTLYNRIRDRKIRAVKNGSQTQLFRNEIVRYQQSLAPVELG
jgi:excisionase family DNA binding protein